MLRGAFVVIFWLLLNVTLLNSLFWLGVTPWFRPIWFATLAFAVLFAALMIRMANRNKAILRTFEARVAELVSKYLESRAAVVTFSFAPYYLIKLAAIAVLAAGLCGG